MRVRVDIPELLPELCDYLSRRGWVAVDVSPDEAHVVALAAPSEFEAAMMLLADVDLWRGAAAVGARNRQPARGGQRRRTERLIALPARHGKLTSRATAQRSISAPDATIHLARTLNYRPARANKAPPKRGFAGTSPYGPGRDRTCDLGIKSMCSDDAIEPCPVWLQPRCGCLRRDRGSEEVD
jgi:hypothetical protein